MKFFDIKYTERGASLSQWMKPLTYARRIQKWASANRTLPSTIRDFLDDFFRPRKRMYRAL